MWNRSRLTEACKAVHEGLEASSEENCVTEVRSAVMQRCAAHERPKDHVESGIWSVTKRSASVTKGFADQPKRQATGNIKHALTAETPLLVRESRFVSANSLQIAHSQAYNRKKERKLSKMHAGRPCGASYGSC